jgi:hypothetical protein
MLALLVGVATTLGLQGVVAADKEPAKKVTRSNLDLTPKSFPQLFALIPPQATEWRHLQVQWLTDVVAARRLAAKEDKPIVVLYTGGAGYNEPLGVC